MGGVPQDKHFVFFPGEAVEFLDLIEGSDGIGLPSDEEDAVQVVVNPAGRMEFGRLSMQQAGEFAKASSDE